MMTLAMAGLAGGGYLLYQTASRAVSGDLGAMWVLVLFVLSLGLIVAGITKFWVLMIDHSDALDVFREAASRLGAEPRHFRVDATLGQENVTESGYEFSFADQDGEINIRLFQVGKSSEQEKIRFDDHTLLTLRMPANENPEMAIVHPTFDVTDSADMERYAPIVLRSHAYVYVKHGVVFSNVGKAIITPVFDNLFVQNLMAEIFYHYRFKFMVFQDRFFLAMKSVTVESLEQDIESYKLFINLRDLLEESHRKLITT